MEYLIASIAALFIGPVLHRLASSGRSVLALLDGFTLVAICGIVLIDVLPESIEYSGWGALLVLIVGLYGPTLFERIQHRFAQSIHNIALLLALIGMLIHGVLDGMALSNLGQNIGLAVLLHRVPVGLTIWILLRPQRGIVPTLACLGLLAASTVFGFFGGEQFVGHISPSGMGYFQALVGGSLLHVLLHTVNPVKGDDGLLVRFASGAGALLALATATFMFTHEHLPESPDADTPFQFFALLKELALESAPALVFAYLAAGLIFAFLPKGTISWLQRGGPLRQSLKGLGFGLPLPICSCGVIPVYKSLVLRGVPVAAGLSFLVATPELGIDAVFLTFQFFGFEYAMMRILAAAAVALLIGWTLGRFLPARTAQQANGQGPQSDQHLDDAVGGSAWKGTLEIVDSTGPWVLFGLALAAFCMPLLDSAALAQLNGQVLIFALLGMPVYVCASGATPLMAIFIAHGVSPGAALAFLITGPATNVTTFGILSQLHGRRLALCFGLGVASLAIVAGYLINWLAPEMALRDFSQAHEHNPWSWACLYALALLYGVSLLRRGPRAFIGEVLANGDSTHDDHDHGDPANCC